MLNIWEAEAITRQRVVKFNGHMASIIDPCSAQRGPCVFPYLCKTVVVVLIKFHLHIILSVLYLI